MKVQIAVAGNVALSAIIVQGELLSNVVDDAESQAADFIPSLKIAPAITSGSNTLPLSFRHRF
jgi:hypothetical protein